MVKLTPEQQVALVAARPRTFAPVPGGWGRRGSTHVLLATAHRAAVQDALGIAWRNVAPARLARAHPRVGRFEG